MTKNITNSQITEAIILSNKKVIITSDSTCDLSEELIKKYNIKTIPMGVTLGDKLYYDGVDITPDKIYDYFDKTGVLPKTSAINMADFSDLFEKLTGEGYAVINFTISSEMSTTFNTSRLAAEDFDDVYTIDTRNLSTGGGLLVLKAAELAEKGESAEKIVEIINDMIDRVDASFVIDKLNYLHKGGRCSSVAALGANLLKLKPCIEVKGGKMGVGKKYRGKYGDVLKEYIEERLQNASDIELERIFVTHAGVDEEIVNAVYNQVKKALPFNEVLITRAGCTISSHCGPDTLGILFVRKSPIEK